MQPGTLSEVVKSFHVLANGVAVSRTGNAVMLHALCSEVRGDWKWQKDSGTLHSHATCGCCYDILRIILHLYTGLELAQEWLGLTTGWSSTQLCHHCPVTHTAFAVAPSILSELPRRTLEEIRNCCTHRGIRSTLS